MVKTKNPTPLTLVRIRRIAEWLKTQPITPERQGYVLLCERVLQQASSRTPLPKDVNDRAHEARRALARYEAAGVFASVPRKAPAMRHPDGSAMYPEDAAKVREANRLSVQRDARRARYLKQYPETIRELAQPSAEPWPLAGVEELRAAARWADGQPESDHDYRTAEDVLTAYRKACKEEG